MQIILTPKLLRFLINQGYRYCLSKTRGIASQLAEVCVMLKPVHLPPLAANLPEGFDEYFLIHEEPATLANGIEGVITVACLDRDTLMGYVTSLRGRGKKSSSR